MRRRHTSANTVKRVLLEKLNVFCMKGFTRAHLIAIKLPQIKVHALTKKEFKGETIITNANIVIKHLFRILSALNMKQFTRVKSHTSATIVIKLSIPGVVALDMKKFTLVKIINYTIANIAIRLSPAESTV